MFNDDAHDDADDDDNDDDVEHEFGSSHFGSGNAGPGCKEGQWPWPRLKE